MAYDEGMLALLCCAVLAASDRPGELHALPQPPSSRFAISRRTDAPLLGRIHPEAGPGASVPGWTEPPSIEVRLTDAPAVPGGRWQLPGEAGSDPAQPSLDRLFCRYDRAMRYYGCTRPRSGFVMVVSGEPCH